MLYLVNQVLAQTPGALKKESHPKLSVASCTKSGGCKDEQKMVTIDSNWRWTHENGVAKNCYTGNKWDDTLCPDPDTCTKNCVIEGADAEYESTYGVIAQGADLRLNFVTQGPSSKNVGSRTYLLDDDKTYQMFKLKNREFTFDVDVSNLPCGLNGALYFVQMDADGGLSKYETNTAGAEYGTGYCDAQCPHDLKYINGETNIIDWTPSATDPNSGTGKYGTCCVEMDIWEANSISTAFTPHACSVKEQTRCSGEQCGDNPDHRFDGVCDKNGCDFQTYRLGNETFYGKGSNFAIDTSKPVTVTTRFVTEGNTDTGKLVEIQRFYTQGGKVIQTPSISVGGKGPFNSVSKEYCEAEVGLFADHTNFLEKGGMDSMDSAMESGMVLVMSLWDDHSVNMLWLDSTYPTDGKNPGDKRGSCSITSGDPKQVESQSADAYVKYFNIKFGEIGSTTTGGPPPPSPTPPSPPPAGPGYRCHARKGQCVTSPLSKQSKKDCQATCKKSAVVEAVEEEFTAKTCPTKPWMQCDGASFAGASCCPMGFECLERTAEFHQCVPSAALTEAFVHTQPSKKMVENFLRDGTTLFPSSGLTSYPKTDAAAPRVVAA